LPWSSSGVADGWVGNALSKVGATTDAVAVGAGGDDARAEEEQEQEDRAPRLLLVHQREARRQLLP
jgi:hypothetical protein